MLVIIIFRIINDESVVTAVFKIAGYTYGPLLGLYTFGVFINRNVRDNLVPVVCVLAPILTYLISFRSEEWLWGYKFGFEVLLLNGLLTILGLLSISTNKNTVLEPVM